MIRRKDLPRSPGETVEAGAEGMHPIHNVFLFCGGRSLRHGRLGRVRGMKFDDNGFILLTGDAG